MHTSIAGSTAVDHQLANGWLPKKLSTANFQSIQTLKKLTVIHTYTRGTDMPFFSLIQDSHSNHAPRGPILQPPAHNTHLADSKQSTSIQQQHGHMHSTQSTLGLCKRRICQHLCCHAICLAAAAVVSTVCSAAGALLWCCCGGRRLCWCQCCGSLPACRVNQLQLHAGMFQPA